MIQIEELQPGEGIEAKDGDKVTMHYRGMFKDGKEFDSSYQRGPFSFKLGASQVIKGFDLGVLGMKIGSKRRLSIPSELGYGSRGSGSSIPPNSDLIFEVELLGIE